MVARNEWAIAQLFQRSIPHPRHQAHVENNVGRVSDLNTDAGRRRAQRPHAVGNDVESPSFHAAAKKLYELFFHLSGTFPVISRPGVLFFFGANKGIFFDAGHIVGMGAAPKTAWM